MVKVGVSLLLLSSWTPYEDRAYRLAGMHSPKSKMRMAKVTMKVPLSQSRTRHGTSSWFHGMYSFRRVQYRAFHTWSVNVNHPKKGWSFRGCLPGLQGIDPHDQWQHIATESTNSTSFPHCDGWGLRGTLIDKKYQVTREHPHSAALVHRFCWSADEWW